ncbi:MAG: TraR/DksA C4-type zinc finger protein [Pseudomonadota bacterium]
MDDEALGRMETLIRERLDAIAVEEAATAEDRRPVALDQQSVGRLSRMDAMQVQAMAAAQSRRRGAERVRLQSALRRIAEGEFGWCEACGEAIAERRLALDPGLTRCVDCAGGSKGA